MFRMQQADGSQRSWPRSGHRALRTPSSPKLFQSSHDQYHQASWIQCCSVQHFAADAESVTCLSKTIEFQFYVNESPRCPSTSHPSHASFTPTRSPTEDAVKLLLPRHGHHMFSNARNTLRSLQACHHIIFDTQRRRHTL